MGRMQRPTERRLGIKTNMCFFKVPYECPVRALVRPFDGLMKAYFPARPRSEPGTRVSRYFLCFGWGVRGRDLGRGPVEAQGRPLGRLLKAL